MRHSFDARLDRLRLHDSSIEKMERVGSDVIIEFDWAKLADFEEKGLGPLIVGLSQIVLIDVMSEKYTEEKIKGIVSETSKPKDFLTYLETIGKNESTSDKQIRISGLYMKSPEYRWINLEFEFNKFQFCWDKHATYEEWLYGKLPE